MIFCHFCLVSVSITHGLVKITLVILLKYSKTSLDNFHELCIFLQIKFIFVRYLLLFSSVLYEIASIVSDINCLILLFSLIFSLCSFKTCSCLSSFVHNTHSTRLDIHLKNQPHSFFLLSLSISSALLKSCTVQRGFFETLFSRVLSGILVLSSLLGVIFFI